jgi:hypothetical protein
MAKDHRKPVTKSRVRLSHSGCAIHPESCGAIAHKSIFGQLRLNTDEEKLREGVPGIE